MSATKRETADGELVDAVLRALPEGVGALGFATVVTAWAHAWGSQIPDDAKRDLALRLRSFAGVEAGGGLRRRTATTKTTKGAR